MHHAGGFDDIQESLQRRVQQVKYEQRENGSKAGNALTASQ